jgi:alkylation response protein AidB-like acyl-CoA dehydrogenase
MYGLDISEEDELLVETLHAFAESEMRDAAREAERMGSVPTSLTGMLHQMGLAAPVPEQFGGQDIPDLTTSLRIAEELAWGDAAIARAALAGGQAGFLIASCGTPEQQAKHLPRFAGATPLRASVLLGEGFGRQPSESRTKALPNATGWTLHGEKLGVLHPDDAELSVVIAREGEDGAIGAFVIEGTSEGWTVLRNDGIVGTLGLEAAPSGSVRLDGVQVPADGRLESGLVLARAIARIRLVHAATLLGCARASKEFAQSYANERIAFGRPISSFQGIAFMLADRDMAIDAARMELFEVADDLRVLEDTRDIERLCQQVVDRCSQVALETTRDGVQTLGGHGFIREYPVERWYRAAATLTTLDFDPLAAQVSFL